MYRLRPQSVVVRLGSGVVVFACAEFVVTFIEATSATVTGACGDLSEFPIKINSLKKYLKNDLVHGASDDFAPAEITGRTKDPVETYRSGGVVQGEGV